VEGSPLLNRERLIVIRSRIVEVEGGEDDGEIVRMYTTAVTEGLYDEHGQAQAELEPAEQSDAQAMDVVGDSMGMSSVGRVFTGSEARRLMSLLADPELYDQQPLPAPPPRDVV
jgi:hypothetical protein